MSVGSAVGGGMDIAGAMGAFNPPAPISPNYYGDMQNQIMAGKQQVNANATLDPIQANTQQGVLEANLFGSPGYSQTIHGKTVNYASTPGDLAMMQQAAPELTGIATQDQAQELGADMTDMGNLAPAAYQTIRGYNPQETGLMDTLDNQAQQQLSTNGGLTPAQQQQLQQQVRSSQAARGMGNGSGDAAQEAYYLFNNQQQLRSQNQQFASGVAGQEQNLYGSPYQVLGMPTPGVQNLNYGQPTGNTVQNMQAPAANLYDQYYNAQLGQQAGAWQTQQKYLSGLTSGSGSSGGGSSGGSGGGGMSSMAGLAMMFI